jgi:hypothetical protein
MRKFQAPIIKRLGFDSLYFEICLEFGFCYLGFSQLRPGKGRTLQSNRVWKLNKGKSS